MDYDPSAEEIFSTLQSEFTRVTGTTPPPSPGQPRCLYTFRVDVSVERVGRRYRLVSVRPVRNPGGPYANVRRERRTGPTDSRNRGRDFPEHHPYDPPPRQRTSHATGGGVPPSTSSASFSSPSASSAFASSSRISAPLPGSPLEALFNRARPPPSRSAPFTSSSSASPSQSSSRTSAGSAQDSGFDPESHQRFLNHLERMIQAEERLKAQKARATQANADSGRGDRSERTHTASR